MALRVDRLRRGRAVGRAQSGNAPIALNLGIDFGTSFTKVCVRDAATDDTAVVTFASASPEGAMIPSVVHVSKGGGLTLPQGTGHGKTLPVRYLKMRLTGVEFADGREEECRDILDKPQVIKVLSSWFLATVIVQAKAWVSRHWADRLKGRVVEWSANVGVPVEHADSPKLAEFEEVLGVAWQWAQADEVPLGLRTALSSYKDTANTVTSGSANCHAVPEIAAAVLSFVMSQESAPGIYIYVDVGGGTVDGVSFAYVNIGGERRINFFSGRVAALGAAVVAERVAPDTPREFEAALIGNTLDEDASVRLLPSRKDLQRLVQRTVWEGKQRDKQLNNNRDWRHGDLQQRPSDAWTLRVLDDKAVPPLIVFVGGGGAPSHWFQEGIFATYGDKNLKSFGIPPFELLEGPTPKDLDLGGLDSRSLLRFGIAYGLSVPFGEGPEITLPTQYADSGLVPVIQRTPTVDYLDSKDAFD